MALNVKSAAVSATAATEPTRVAVLEWVDPLMSCGYWIPELVTASGCECVLAGVGEHTGYVTVDELLAARPSHVIIASCGFAVPRCASELVTASPQSRQAVAALAEATAGVWVADGNRFFNRSGPGVVESAVIVAQAVAGGAPVPGEPDLRGTSGFISLQEALEMEGTSLAEFISGAQTTDVPPQSALAAEQAAVAALAGATAVVAALQRGDVDAAHALSAVSAHMSVSACRAVIVDGEDYAPLSDGGLEPEWIGAPELLTPEEAKLRVRLVNGADEKAGAVEYDFRMALTDLDTEYWKGVFPDSSPGKTWMVKAVNKL